MQTISERHRQTSNPVSELWMKATSGTTEESGRWIDAVSTTAEPVDSSVGDANESLVLEAVKLLQWKQFP